MTIKDTFNTNKSSLALLGDIKCYLSTVQAQPLSKIYSQIPEGLLQTNVNDVKLVATLSFPEDSNPKTLSITRDSENPNDSPNKISKAALSSFGLGIYGFLNDIKAIQDTNSNNTLQEAIEKTIKASHKRLSEDQLSHAILQYTQLYEKVRLLNPTNSKEEIFARLDNHFHNHFKNTNELTSTYYDFINAYQNKKAGFFSIFGDEKDDLAPYNITQKLIENSGSALTAYINIIHTIEKLPSYLQDKASAKQLVDNLKYLSDSYFSNLLKINSSESSAETKINARMEAFKNFKTKSSDSIKNYKKDHPEESTRAKIFLHKLLWLITRLIPSINKEKRMMMFGGPKKASSLLFENIDREATRIAPAA